MCIKPINIINKNTGEEVRVECGKCVQCRMKKCRTWALKLYHESQYHSKMCMITLTFKPAFLFRPRIKKLEKWKTVKDESGLPKRIKSYYTTMINPNYIKDVKKTGWLLTLFNKKLRKYFATKGIFYNFFAVGEHGSQNTHRAHWHIILFGVSKEDLGAVNIGKSKKGKEIYYSKLIEDLWNYDKMNIGHHTISDVTTATIKYVANYTMKKMYKNTSGEEEYKTCMRFSNRGKIGLKWARRYHKELRKGYLKDNDGCKYMVPKAYYNEMIRFEDKPENYNYEITARAIEANKDELINKLMEAGVLTEENLKRKAEKMEKRLRKQERDTI